jgi:hypothetical protein
MHPIYRTITSVAVYEILLQKYFLQLGPGVEPPLFEEAPLHLSRLTYSCSCNWARCRAPSLRRSTSASRPTDMQLGRGFERGLHVTLSLTPHCLESHDRVSAPYLLRSTGGCCWVSSCVRLGFRLRRSLVPLVPNLPTSHDKSYHSTAFPGVGNLLPPDPDARANSLSVIPVLGLPGRDGNMGPKEDRSVL